MLCRPKLIATLIIVHKHSYLEGNLTGAACPLSKIKAIAFPTGHMPSQDVGICLGFQYQTWTLFCGPSIAQTFLIVVYDLVFPVSIMHPGGQWVTLQDLLSSIWGLQELGPTASYINSHDHSWSPFTQSQGSSHHAASCPHSVLASKALALEILQEKRNLPQ